MKTRRMFEPTGKFDRVLYVLMALTCPRTAIYALSVEDESLRFAGAVFAGWSIIAAFSTIDWALVSYRGWRARKA